MISELHGIATAIEDKPALDWALLNEVEELREKVTQEQFRLLIGWRDYSPRARGMQAALPYVDLFAPAHNLESLAALEPYLAKI